MRGVRIPLPSGRDPDEGSELGTGNIPDSADAHADMLYMGGQCMKAILVLNMPKDFDYRRCSIGGDGNIYYERKGEQRTSIIGNIKNLKPMPTQVIDRNAFAIENKYMNYQDGYNACIDKILGE